MQMSNTTKWIQWAILALIAGILIYAGENSWLVRHRNFFLIFLLVLSFATVWTFYFLSVREAKKKAHDTVSPSEGEGK